MLSDTMKYLRDRFASDPELSFILRAAEMEAREMEGRLFLLTGMPHVPLRFPDVPERKEVRDVA
ncbi:MAG: hypothetical protein ABGX47_08255 [Martelella sp.]|uniref:hypothetical protein n=1 Tax=Martelella sp. TaxID=1969699 RepID=UPI003242BB6D